VAIGYGLDQWLGTEPWFILAGSLFGIVSIFVHVFRLAQRLDRESARRKAQGAKLEKHTVSADDTDASR
jgi:F0F1-type ATP synthase assembly protein I